MSHNTDYDEEQFQRDLNKALALSMEQKALDDTRRKFLYGDKSNQQPSVNRSLSIQSPPPISQRQRVSLEASANNFGYAQTPRPSAQVEDLISFTSPTAQQAKTTSFDKLIQELALQAAAPTQVPLQPRNALPTAQTPAPPFYMLPSNVPLAANGSREMVLYEQPKKIELNSEQLNMLYNQSQHPIYPPYQYHMPMSTPHLNPYQYPSAANAVPSTLNAPQTYGWSHYGTGAPDFNQHASALPSNAIPIQQSTPPVNDLEEGGAVKRTESTASIGLRSTPTLQRPRSGNDLIDLSPDDDTHLSVLEIFDPLLNNNSEVDDFSNYLYTSNGTEYSDPVYDAVNKLDNSNTNSNASVSSYGWRSQYMASNGESEYGQQSFDDDYALNSSPGVSTGPPLPPAPRNTSAISKSITLDRRKVCTRLYEAVTAQHTNDPELLQFYEMIKELRSSYRYDDVKTNVGHIVASQFAYLPLNTSIKIIVHPALDILKPDVKDNLGSKPTVKGYGVPVAFTCDIKTPVDVVIHQALNNLNEQIKASAVDNCALKVIGVSEWLLSESNLYQLDCVHNSLKLEQDVQLGLCLKSDENMKVIGRTQRDDALISELRPENILPNEMGNIITYDHMMILLRTLETEIDKLETAAADMNTHSVLPCLGVVQGVKAISSILGSIETLEITDAIIDLLRICNVNLSIYSSAGNNNNVAHGNPEVVRDYGDYAEISIRPRTTVEQVKLKCSKLRDAIEKLIELYSNVYRAGFSVNAMNYPLIPLDITNVLEPVVVNINCLHRLQENWRYDEITLGVQIYYGTRYISDVQLINSVEDTSGFFKRMKFSAWITFEKNKVSSLPLESRLTFVLIGTNKETQDHECIRTELGWCSIQMFDFKREMICGSYLLPMWPPSEEKRLGPAPARGCHPQPDICPVLSIEIPSYGGTVQFPKPKQKATVQRSDFKTLDTDTQLSLLDILEQGYNVNGPKREILWEKRYYLQSIPKALPKVLLSVQSWDCASVNDVYSLLNSWDALAPLQALELLLPNYSDAVVREKAVLWISRLSNDELVNYMPQLLQALKHDTYETSAMARFLLCKCLESPRIAHQMYWLLLNSLPGDGPQNSIDDTSVASEVSDPFKQARYYRRNKMMLRALFAISGEKLLCRFINQNMMCKSLADVAVDVKEAKKSHRQRTLLYSLNKVNSFLQEKPTSLPLGPEIEVNGVNVQNCSYFNSNTLPLKVHFVGPDSEYLPAIFKMGDDLQQDMLTIQLIRMMNKIWLSEGLDLKIITFNCVATGYKKGMIEMVSNAETLKTIQTEHGKVMGSLKEYALTEWLRKQNPSELEYQRAVKNFTVSTAGYCVATYLLGICDRHNENIMLKTSGHLFHIDFGKFLGDAQKFGNFKRDRTPFVFTSDMAYVINNGDKQTSNFHRFIDFCCIAFNIIRKHGDFILHMLAHLATAGIPGVTSDAVTYVQRALLLPLSNAKASATFAAMIKKSQNNIMVPLNFVIHNLAQYGASNESNSQSSPFTFVPKTYTTGEDDRLTSVQVVRCQKHYDTEKYYTYIIRVERFGQKDPTHIFRTYKEFVELYDTLTKAFPGHKFYNLKSINMGRSHIKSVAERRLIDINNFLCSLFKCRDEIAHSDYVYTFFHPVLRDQQEANLDVAKMKEVKNVERETSHEISQLQISFQYSRGIFSVLVLHAVGLPILPGNQEPTTYVKCYLMPDPHKKTKRKTDEVEKSCVPSYMEVLEYNMPLNIVRNRLLHVTVWTSTSMHENELLGGFTIDLSQYDLTLEVNQWFRLGPVSRH